MALFVTGDSVTKLRDEVLSCGAIQFNPDAGVNIILTRHNKGDCWENVSTKHPKSWLFFFKVVGTAICDALQNGPARYVNMQQFYQ